MIISLLKTYSLFISILFFSYKNMQSNNLINLTQMLRKKYDNKVPFQNNQFDEIQESITSFNQLTGNIDCKKAYGVLHVKFY